MATGPARWVTRYPRWSCGERSCGETTPGARDVRVSFGAGMTTRACNSSNKCELVLRAGRSGQAQLLIAIYKP